LVKTAYVSGVPKGEALDGDHAIEFTFDAIKYATGIPTPNGPDD
jgi:hypothetical protein